MLQQEFENRLKVLNIGNKVTDQVMELFLEMMNEYPCLSCPSKDECDNFKWYIKWSNRK